MKSRQISGIHFFSVSLQLKWMYMIGAPFLNCNAVIERSSTGFDIHLVIVFFEKIWRKLFGLGFTYLVLFLNR